MEIIEPGHVYRLHWLDGEPQPDGMGNRGGSDLIFVNREDSPHPGTQTQEVLRALIDRTMHCDNCLRWPGNDAIIFHLRMALVLHECRALMRKLQKGELDPERVTRDADGHFLLTREPRGTDANIYHARLKTEQAKETE